MNFLGSLRACAIVIVLATTGLGAIVFLTSASPSRANQAVAGTIGERSLDAEPPVNEAQQNLPVNVGPRSTNADTWRAIRRGLQGMAATPDQPRRCINPVRRRKLAKHSQRPSFVLRVLAVGRRIDRARTVFRYSRTNWS